MEWRFFSEKPSIPFFICLYFVVADGDENLKKIFGKVLALHVHCCSKLIEPGFIDH